MAFDLFSATFSHSLSIFHFTFLSTLPPLHSVISAIYHIVPCITQQYTKQPPLNISHRTTSCTTTCYNESSPNHLIVLRPITSPTKPPHNLTPPNNLTHHTTLLTTTPHTKQTTHHHASLLHHHAGQLVHTFSGFMGGVKVVRCALTSPLLLCGGLDRSLMLFHLHSRKLLWKVSGRG